MLGIAGAVLGAVASAFIVLILSLYFLSALPALRTAIVRLSPASRRARAGYLSDQIFLRIRMLGLEPAGALHVPD